MSQVKRPKGEFAWDLLLRKKFPDEKKMHPEERLQDFFCNNHLTSHKKKSKDKDHKMTKWMAQESLGP